MLLEELVDSTEVEVEKKIKNHKRMELFVFQGVHQNVLDNLEKTIEVKIISDWKD